ncbi:MAG: hypothetical protein WC755_01535 [Candidatus Woesearchaeota archaeon]|jgi:hypothetical protein
MTIEYDGIKFNGRNNADFCYNHKKIPLILHTNGFGSFTSIGVPTEQGGSFVAYGKKADFTGLMIVGLENKSLISVHLLFQSNNHNKPCAVLVSIQPSDILSFLEVGPVFDKDMKRYDDVEKLKSDLRMK